MFKRIILWGDVTACLVVLVVALCFRPHTVALYAGTLLVALTCPFWILARVQLGSAFSVKAEARRLVTHGLYSKFRHPIYLFGSLTELGALTALQFWFILAIWAVLTPIEFVRIRRENRVLREAFGEEYERYRRSTWL